MELIKLDNRPLGAVHRSSSRLFGPRTYPDGLPIWGIRVKPETALYNALRLGTPTEMNHTVLSAAAQELCSERDDEIVSAFSSQVQYFPDKENNYDGSGSYIRLKSETYSKEFQDLKTKGL